MGNTIIIGLTGSFGSGCTYLAKNHIVPKELEYISLSDILREMWVSENPEEVNPSRSTLQEYGNKVRSENPRILAEKALELIRAKGVDKKFVIDSIRNPNEIYELKNFSSNFYLFGIFAEDVEVRWKRVKTKYDGNQKAFETDDNHDRSETLLHGQRVSECFANSDIVIANSYNYKTKSKMYNDMQNKIDKYLTLIESPNSMAPTQDESLMAAAYASAQRSNCLKRKVGAVIVDCVGNPFSIGFNAVPTHQDDCKSAHGNCYRDILKLNITKAIEESVGNHDAQKRLTERVVKRFKNLDYCRALHAEENAILNVARNGSGSLKGATLYTTTYPCNLCANKIAQVGVSTVIYFELYPMEEAKEILTTKGIKQKPFEGVTYNAFFRLYGDKPQL